MSVDWKYWDANALMSAEICVNEKYRLANMIMSTRICVSTGLRV